MTQEASMIYNFLLSACIQYLDPRILFSITYLKQCSSTPTETSSHIYSTSRQTQNPFRPSQNNGPQKSLLQRQIQRIFIHLQTQTCNLHKRPPHPLRKALQKGRSARRPQLRQVLRRCSTRLLRGQSKTRREFGVEGEGQFVAGF